MWSQGSPIPLNLSRIDGSHTATAAAASGSPPVPLSTAEQTLIEPTCTGGFGGAYYWDGSAWKQMTVPAILKTKQGYSMKAGLESFGSTRATTAIIRYENATAPLSLTSRPRFALCARTSDATANFVIGRLDVRKDYREIETLSRLESYGSMIWIPKKRLEPVDVKRVSDTVVEVTPKDPLAPGEYLLVHPGPTVEGNDFDFGVEEKH
jgi:hypothetical protein